MKRAIIIGTACALLVSAIAWATQVWRDGVDAGNHPLANVSTFQVNNGVGAGTRCAQFDAAGNLLPSSAACGAGLGGSAGGVSSVTGTAQHISATPTTGAVIVDTIGGYSTGAVTAGNVSMGALASGVNEQVTTAGVAAPLTYAATANDVQFGAASGGGLAQSSTFAFNSNRLSVGQSTFDGNFHAVLADNPTPTGVATWDGRYAVFGQSGPTGGAVAFSYGNTAATGYMTVAVPNSAFVHFQANAADYAWYVGGTTLGSRSDVFGVYDSLLSTNGLMKTTGGTGLHAIATAGTDYQLPLVACTDYVHIACQSGTSDLSNTDGAVHVASIHDGVGSQHTTTGAWGANLLLQTDATGSIAVGGLPNDIPQAGDILVTNSVAPSTPAAGKTRCYVDSTSKNGACKNDAGTVNHGIQTVSCSAHQWVSAISDAGGSACVQPAFTDINGTATISQLPALAFYAQQWATVRTSAFGALSILSNKQTVLALANGMDQGFASTAAGGTAIATTIAANFTNFPDYPTFQGFAHASLSVNIMNLVGTGSGTATVVIELFSENLGSPSSAGSYTSLGSVSQSFTSASASFFMGLTTTLSAIPVGGLVLVAYRSDSTATLSVSNGIAFSATLIATNP